MTLPQPNGRANNLTRPADTLASSLCCWTWSGCEDGSPAPSRWRASGRFSAALPPARACGQELPPPRHSWARAEAGTHESSVCSVPPPAPVPASKGKLQEPCEQGEGLQSQAVNLSGQNTRLLICGMGGRLSLRVLTSLRGTQNKLYLSCFHCSSMFTHYVKCSYCRRLCARPPSPGSDSRHLRGVGTSSPSPGATEPPRGLPHATGDVIRHSFLPIRTVIFFRCVCEF